MSSVAFRKLLSGLLLCPYNGDGDDTWAASQCPRVTHKRGVMRVLPEQFRFVGPGLVGMVKTKPVIVRPQQSRFGYREGWGKDKERDQATEYPRTSWDQPPWQLSWALDVTVDPESISRAAAGREAAGSRLPRRLRFCLHGTWWGLRGSSAWALAREPGMGGS